MISLGKWNQMPVWQTLEDQSKLITKIKSQMLTQQKHYKPTKNGAVLINITTNKQYTFCSANEMTETI